MASGTGSGPERHRRSPESRRGRVPPSSPLSPWAGLSVSLPEQDLWLERLGPRRPVQASPVSRPKVGTGLTRRGSGAGTLPRSVRLPGPNPCHVGVGTTVDEPPLGVPRTRRRGRTRHGRPMGLSRWSARVRRRSSRRPPVPHHDDSVLSGVPYKTSPPSGKDTVRRSLDEAHGTRRE